MKLTMHYQLLVFEDYAILLLFYLIKQRLCKNKYMEVQLSIGEGNQDYLYAVT